MVKMSLAIALCGLCPFIGCGGNESFGGGSPKVAVSAASLGFGTEIVGETSQPLPLTLANSGTAILNITSITATANFGETHDCGPTLAAGANCTINVTFQPAAAGDLTGMISISDNAAGSPHTVLLSGSGSISGPNCTAKGQQCPPQFPPCCPGLTCSAASTRAFCE
jgi:Abnormal spindle-like microcephaly-assoc'd, ASPM-SPD-2-Hydin